MSKLNIKSLKKIANDLEIMERYANYKRIGYEPKCKICNSEYQNQVEALKEDDYTLEEMRDFLGDHGETVSIMSLSRHFERHYPTRKAYLMGLDEEKAQMILEGEKVIEKDIKYDPEFEEVLEGDISIYDYVDGEYKEIKKKARDVYIFDYGYCFTGDHLCKYVPKLKRLGGEEVTANMNTELFKINNGLVNDWMGEKKTKILEEFIECMQCQVTSNDCKTLGLLNLVLWKQYGATMEEDEFNKLISNVDFIPEEMDEELKKYAAKEREGAINKS